MAVIHQIHSPGINAIECSMAFLNEIAKLKDSLKDITDSRFEVASPTLNLVSSQVATASIQYVLQLRLTLISKTYEYLQYTTGL